MKRNRLLFGILFAVIATVGVVLASTNASSAQADPQISPLCQVRVNFTIPGTDAPNHSVAVITIHDQDGFAGDSLKLQMNPPIGTKGIATIKINGTTVKSTTVLNPFTKLSYTLPRDLIAPTVEIKLDAIVAPTSRSWNINHSCLGPCRVPSGQTQSPFGRVACELSRAATFVPQGVETFTSSKPVATAAVVPVAKPALPSLTAPVKDVVAPVVSVVDTAVVPENQAVAAP